MLKIYIKMKNYCQIESWLFESHVLSETEQLTFFPFCVKLFIKSCSDTECIIMMNGCIMSLLFSVLLVFEFKPSQE